MSDSPRLGGRLRALRAEHRLTQAALAERLGISPSYLNLLEHDRRPLTANLLVRLAERFDLDAARFAASDDASIAADLRALFDDALFEQHPLGDGELTELAAAHPAVARAVLHLQRAYLTARESAERLTERALDAQAGVGTADARLPAEEVSELLQRHRNHFPALELAAERLWAGGPPTRVGRFERLVEHLDRVHRVRVTTRTVAEMRGAIRRYDAAARVLEVSELLGEASRDFQLAWQVGMLGGGELLDDVAGDASLSFDASRALARAALASYFAAAVLMPYAAFHDAAEAVRYDVELLGRRFRASFEQVCHRLTTLGRPGAEGVPFDMVRVDVGGNITKRYSADRRIRLPRFGGLCPLWNVHAAFLQPGTIRTQLARLPDGTTFFSVARALRKPTGDHHAPVVHHAIALTCHANAARRLVYADGVELADPTAPVPVGITCRLCERSDCQARAFPSLHTPPRLDPTARGVSIYTEV